MCASTHLSDLPAVDVLPVEVGDVSGVELCVALGAVSAGHGSGLGEGGLPGEAGPGGGGHGPQARAQGAEHDAVWSEAA